MWLSAAEVGFLKAEGALAGWTMGGTAKELYEQAVKLSFEQWVLEMWIAIWKTLKVYRLIILIRVLLQQVRHVIL